MSRRILLALALLAPPVGLLISGMTGEGRSRDRIDVQFVGMRVPVARLLPCGQSTPLSEGGVWIGGGARRTDDLTPDVLAVPGYRPRLIELCRDQPAAGAAVSSIIVMRAVEEGKSIIAQQLIEADGADTQRVVLTGPGQDSAPKAECLRRNNNQITRIDAITDDLWAARKRELASRTERGVRGWLRDHSPFGGLGEPSVYCADLTTATPARCRDPLTSGAPTAMLWADRRITGMKTWSIVPPRDAQWCACDGSSSRSAVQAIRMDPAALDARETWGAWRRAAAPVTFRMINRRTVASVADQSVVVPADSVAPPAFWLGREYVLRIGTSGSDLILMFEEPSVQLRLDDLFGGATRHVLPDGVFDVTFGAPKGDELLVADLAAPADRLLPKPAFADLHARVSITEKGDDLTVAAGGHAPQKLSFGDIFTVPVRNADAPKPMLVIRRVSAPQTTYAIPLLAALLLVIGLYAESNIRGDVERYWLVIPAMSALLQYRFALATRDLVNGWSTDAAVRVWIQDGAWLLAGPALLVAVVWLLRRVGRPRASAQPPTPSRLPAKATAPTPVIAPAKRRWATTSAPAPATRNPRFARVRAMFRRISGNVPAPLLWIAPLTACALVWTIVGPRINAERVDTLSSLFKTSLAIVVATWAAWWIYRASKSERAAGLHTLGRAFLFAAMYIVARFFSYAAGSQEQVFGMRVDVLSLPAAAALLAAFTHYGGFSRQRWRAGALMILTISCFGVVALFHNDFGLLWLGAMAVALALPATFSGSRWAWGMAAVVFFIAFVAPGLAPEPFRNAWRALRQNQQTVTSGATTVEFEDKLQVARERDYYRLLDANHPELVEAIPSQLAREVVIERERVRYQSMDGALRHAFRGEQVKASPWLGAGFLHGRSTSGDPTFVRAARSDYVYPTYVRAEFGTLGLFAIIALYVALFAAATASLDGSTPSALALWSAAIGVGTAFFMIGGSARLFPFSGKWPLFLSFASSSDIALGLVLCALSCLEEDVV